MESAGDEVGLALAGIFGVIWLVAMLFGLLLTVVMVSAQWKMFGKANRPGWAALVPFYNVYVMCDMVGKPNYFILHFIPIVNIYFAVMTHIELARAFGKGAGFGIGLIFFPYVFYPMLGFGSAQYIGPSDY